MVHTKNLGPDSYLLNKNESGPKLFVWTTSNQATSPTCSWLSLFLSFFLLQVGFKVMIFGCYLYLVGVEISQSTDKLCLGVLVTWNCTLSGSAIGWRNGPHFHIYPASDGNQMQLGSSSFTIGPTIILGGTATSQATATVTNAIN